MTLSERALDCDAKYVDYRLVESRASRVYCCCWLSLALWPHTLCVYRYIHYTEKPSRAIFIFSFNDTNYNIYSTYNSLGAPELGHTVAIQNKNVKCCKLNREVIAGLMTTIDYRSLSRQKINRHDEADGARREWLALFDLYCWHYSTSPAAAAAMKVSIKADTLLSTTFDDLSPFTYLFIIFWLKFHLFNFIMLLNSQGWNDEFARLNFFSMITQLCMAAKSMGWTLTLSREIITRFITSVFFWLFSRKISFHLLNGTRGNVSQQIE